MAKLEILMPSMGESIFECTVLKWLVNVGDTVAVDDMIIEVATDKIDTEIGSSYNGVITKFLVNENDIAIIGKPICIIETEDNIVESVSFTSPDKAALEIEKQIENISQSATNQIINNKFYSPLVINIAKEENILTEELDKIKGTGLKGRVTKEDVMAYVAKRKKTPTPFMPAPSAGADQVIEMDRMRKMIAQRMVDSKRISPHVTSFIETDMSAIVDWRNKVKKDFEKNHHENLTFTPLLIEAVVNSIKKYPAINAQVDGENIIFKKDINIGMAVALPNGNLIVPVIHNADQYNLIQLASKVNDLANRARTNQLKPEELQAGTYTISNIGSFGNLAGTPIILQPQVAIMAFGIIRKMPAVIETKKGDFIGIRQKMVISHSFDHRIVDGSLGGLFLKSVSDYLEDFNINRQF